MDWCTWNKLNGRDIAIIQLARMGAGNRWHLHCLKDPYRKQWWGIDCILMNGTWSPSPSIPTTLAKQFDFPAGATTKRKCHAQNGALVLSNQKLLRNLIASAMRHVSSIWRKTLLPSRQSLRIARVARAWRLHHRLANPPPKPNESTSEVTNVKFSSTHFTQNTITWHSTIKQQTPTRNQVPTKTSSNNGPVDGWMWLETCFV